MFQGPPSPHAFVVRCKGCKENIPAPVETMPAQPITASAHSLWGAWAVSALRSVSGKAPMAPVEETGTYGRRPGEGVYGTE
jgi:hypothetical protein